MRNSSIIQSCRVGRTETEAVDTGDSAGAFFSTFLGKPGCRYSKKKKKERKKSRGLRSKERKGEERGKKEREERKKEEEGDKD